eukprot:TRINITY_DN67496_c0_g1_i1.p1 TRINITY_DN67496_c0_g1~~TRINITY_DN67496_c0_g1_i1.p1  ORF type:complete len:217 (+),score=37.24 TRINITY_DN67496_c0_g1_i1:25-651(+)
MDLSLRRLLHLKQGVSSEEVVLASGSTWWQKGLLLGCGTLVAAGAVWYVLADGRSDRCAHSSQEAICATCYYRVIDPDMGISLRSAPDTSSDRTPHVLLPGEAFEVSQVLEGSAGQNYLLLADGRGWAFTQSPKTRQMIAEPCTREQVQQAGGTALEKVEEMLRGNPSMQARLFESLGVAQGPDELRQVARRILLSDPNGDVEIEVLK